MIGNTKRDIECIEYGYYKGKCEAYERLLIQLELIGTPDKLHAPLIKFDDFNKERK